MKRVSMRTKRIVRHRALSCHEHRHRSRSDVMNRSTQTQKVSHAAGERESLSRVAAVKAMRRLGAVPLPSHRCRRGRRHQKRLVLQTAPMAHALDLVASQGGGSCLTLLPSEAVNQRVLLFVLWISSVSGIQLLWWVATKKVVMSWSTRACGKAIVRLK